VGVLHRPEARRNGLAVGRGPGASFTHWPEPSPYPRPYGQPETHAALQNGSPWLSEPEIDRMTGLSFSTSPA
jgi:hypothetical protein